MARTARRRRLWDTYWFPGFLGEKNQRGQLRGHSHGGIGGITTRGGGGNPRNPCEHRQVDAPASGRRRRAAKLGLECLRKRARPLGASRSTHRMSSAAL